MNKDKEYAALLNKQIAEIGKEVRSLEFKSNYQDADRLGKYISALSNGACLDNEEVGYLYFGVEDETLELRGTTFDVSRIKARGNQNLEIFLRQYITPKMFQSQKDRYLPMPDYDQSTSNEIILNLPGTVIDENYSLMLLANQSLSLTDAVLLDQVQKGHSISSEAVAMLRKRKLIEGRMPHIYVSKNIAQATDQKVEYSKHKGLADKKCEALLLESLKDHGSLTKKEIVRLLWDVLPDQLNDKQKNTKVYNILRKLRESGRISNITKGNNSLWSLAKS
ncbi:MAG: ATP-binding protein [Bacteroides sp.]